MTTKTTKRTLLKDILLSHNPEARGFYSPSPAATREIGAWFRAAGFETITRCNARDAAPVIDGVIFYGSDALLIFSPQGVRS